MFAKYFFDCWDNLLNNGDVSTKVIKYMLFNASCMSGNT